MKYFISLKKDPPQRPVIEVIRYVKTKKVTYTKVPTYMEASGRVVAGRKVALISEVSGRLMSGDIPLKQGQSFKKGQLLYKDDDREARYTLSAQRSRILTALAAILPDIKIDFPQHFDAIREFFDKVDMEKDLPELPDTGMQDDAFKTFLATKNILNLYYSIKSVEERLRKYRYYAPFNGALSNVYFETGSVVNPGMTIAEIIHTSDYEVEIPIKQKDVAWVNLGTQVEIVAEESGKTWKEEIVRIGDFLDANTQSVSAYASIKEQSKNVKAWISIGGVLRGSPVADAYQTGFKKL